jgi:hypothetical protein
MTRDEYLTLRSKFTPKPVRLVIVAESPPTNGTYFYNPDGKITEWLFAALMLQLDHKPTTKEDGLRELQRRGWVLVDATYDPVNDEKSKKKRNAVILRDYPLLRADLEKMLPDKSTPIILIKVNVCRQLEPMLKEDGFNVLNRGCAVSFPSHGRQPEFHEQFGPILKSLE